MAVGITVCICAATCAAMIGAVLKFPQLRLGRIRLDSYWIITLAGALLLLACGQLAPEALWAALTAPSAVNPLKILVLFLSMTALSVYLDEAGFFRWLAGLALRRAGHNQTALFFGLYATVSVLTVFTSNDVIILTFTPFICCFARGARIDPIPYLVAEFAAANTWSMALLIGNPTNIYLGTTAGIGFVQYLSVMALPTLLGGGVSLGMLYLLFRKRLKLPIEAEPQATPAPQRFPLIIGLTALIGCTVLLAVSSYIGLEMWLPACLSACALLGLSALVRGVRRQGLSAEGRTLRRLPWALIPFMLSMFTLVCALSAQGVTAVLGQALGSENAVLTYGVASFFTCDLINNIPMSVLFCEVLRGLPEALQSDGVFAAVIGSNLGALLTPIGALAGIMWQSLLSKEQVQLPFMRFVKYGAAVSLPALAAALGGLYIVLHGV